MTRTQQRSPDSRYSRTRPCLIALAIILAVHALAPTQTPVYAAATDPDAVSILPLDEGSGTNAGDTSGNGNDGTLIGGAVFEANTADGSAFAVRFDGVDGYIELGTLDVTGSGITLAAWFYAESYPGPSSDPRIVSKATGSSANDHIFMLSAVQSGGFMRLRARLRIGGVATTLIASSGDLPVGAWRHGALTYDGAMLRLYLNGAEVGSTPLSGTVDTDPSVTVAVGAQPPGLDPRFFDGLLDDVRILQRGLSAAEVAALAGGNQPPIANDDGYSTVEDNAIAVGSVAGLLANDSDPETDPLEAVVEDDAAHGVLNVNTDGSFDYTPNGDFYGVDTFTYRASDGTGPSNLATVTLTVTGVNDAPVAVADDYQTAPNERLSVDPFGGVLSNDTDAELNPLRAVLVSGASHGFLSFAANGSFEYMPALDFTGTDSFTYMSSDLWTHGKPFDDKPRDEPAGAAGQVANSNVTTVTIVVAQPPTALDDAYATDEDVQLVVVPAGVLDNDGDNNPPDDLSAVLLTNPSRGTLTSFSPDGSFTYDPDPDSSGVDSFSYLAVDGTTGAKDTAMVTLTVNAVNDAPVAANDNYQTSVNTSLLIAAINGVLANDTDVEADPLQAVFVDDVGDGTLTLNADGSLDYSPDLDFVGVDSFTYRADDLDLTSNLATVSINVTGSSDPDAVAVLPLDENGGTTAADISGSGNDGTLLGGAVFEAASADGSTSSVRLDGVDDYIDLGGLDVNGSGITLAAWFNGDTFPGVSQDPRIISKASGNGTNAHVFMLSTVEEDNVVRIRGRLRIGGSTTTLIAGSGGVLPGEWHHAAMTYDGSTMRLYLDGVEVGSTPLSGTVDTSPSTAVAIGGQPPGLTPRYFDGLIDDVRILQRALSANEIAAIAGPAPSPIIEVWYGDVQDFGASGNPQTLIQVIGRVRETAPLTNVSYRLNGGSSTTLPLGPDLLRLVNWGDYNIEIDNSSLNVGANSVEITAIDAIGKQTVKTVTVNYTAGVVWALPDTLDWASASAVTDEVQIVDGLWVLEGNGIRTVSNDIGYDRLFVAGDYTWVPDYEVIGSLTVHSILPGGSAGFVVGWQGHNGPQNPMLGHPFQALPWILPNGVLQMLRNGDTIVGEKTVGMTLGTEYMMKVRSETLGGGQSNVRVKWWPASSSEPGAWDLDIDVPTFNGSLLPVAHRCDVTFGQIIIAPLGAAAVASPPDPTSHTTPPPTALTLRQNFPNPFSAATAVAFGTTSGGDVTVEVYSVAGQRVLQRRVSVSKAGWHTFTLDGSTLAAGIYFYRVTSARQHVTRKMVILR